MRDYILEITQPGTRIRFENELLLLEAPEKEMFSVPIRETGVLLLTHSGVSVSGTVLSRLTELGIPLVCCDERYLPSGILMPLREHSRQSRYFLEQARASASLKKSLWKQIVQAKIRSQAAFLRFYGFDETALNMMIPKVTSGDVRNHEGIAARIYWASLGIIPARDRKAEDADQLLNYAYTILFALAARAICAAGLHPSLGLHHHNEYNAYCLASDLMEPFRIAADDAVFVWYRETRDHHLTRETRRYLARAVLNVPFQMKQKKMDIFTALSRAAVSLRQCYHKTTRTLFLPEAVPGQTLPPERMEAE